MLQPEYGAGLWHFGQFLDRYATDGYGPPVSTIEAIGRAGEVGLLAAVDINYPFTSPDIELQDVRAALEENGLRAVAITPAIYTQEFRLGSFTNPDAQVRRRAFDLLCEATEIARELECDYVKLWPGQDGWDYPFQVNHADLWQLSVTGVRELAETFPDMRFSIEYKPREPRLMSMSFSSAARTLLGIEEMGVPNVGILMDFGHSLYGGESPADAARLILARDRLFGIDVNDNYRSWDDDMVVGSMHLVETFEFFHVLRDSGWSGIWQLDQFPFREDSVEAARQGVETMQQIHRALDRLDTDALADAQARQDAMAARRLVQDALFGHSKDEG
jgi:xylose isomerase